MQRARTQPHAHLRPSVWAGRLSLGRFVLTLSVNRKPEQDDAPEQITNRLIALRQERGLSREELAAQLQIHPSTVIEMERGRYLPSLRLALRLSELFELPIEAIFLSPTPPERGGERPSSEEEKSHARA
ncbi:MAG TPA: helix-turn-helix transcriptional regulator [Ktedonobacteraceae bacterium]